MKLDTVRGVATEQGRIYRKAINQSIKTSEAARLTYILREIRCSLEAIPPDPVAQQGPSFAIVTVPSDCYVRSDSGLEVSVGPLVLEHRPAEMMPDQADSEIDPAPEIISRTRANISEPVSALEQKLLEMDPDKLLQLARALNVGQ